MNLKFDMKNLFKRKTPAESDSFEAPASDRSKVMRDVAIWIKANLLVLTLSVIAIVAVVAGYVVSSDFYLANEESAQAIGKKYEELAKLERTRVSITIPGNDPIEGSVTVNRKLVDSVKARMSRGESTGDAVVTSALAHNKNIHRPVLSLRLVQGDSKLRQIHLDMHDKLKALYAELVTSGRGALPPAEEDVLVELQRSKLRFVQTELNQNIGDPLTAEQQSKLVADLSGRRLSAYRNIAVNSGLYFDESDLGAPKSALSDPNLEKLWELQWRFWIAEDIVHACMSLNESAPIETAPIKRIVSLKFLGQVGAGATAAPTESEEQPAGETMLEGASSGTGAGGAPINSNAVISLANYALSFRGWASNQMYDVYRTKVTLVVETAKIPLATDAFARQNFMVITDARISPIDPFEAIRAGYFYGEKPVSMVALTLESVWLRQWTGPLMPDVVRARFGTTGQVQSTLAPSEDASIDPNGSQE